MKGTIKVLKQGFGFLECADVDGDVFFHANSLVDVQFDDLNEGETLEFEMGEGKNGKEQAENVTLVEGEQD